MPGFLLEFGVAQYIYCADEVCAKSIGIGWVGCWLDIDWVLIGYWLDWVGLGWVG